MNTGIFLKHCIAGAKTLDPTNNIRADSPHVCRHQRADLHRGGVLQQQELQEGHLLPQGGTRQKAKKGNKRYQRDIIKNF